jgi:hypothetical protein
LQKVELFILVNDLFGQSVDIKRFALEAENGLCADLAGFGNRSARTVAFSYENGAFQTVFVVGIVMHLAVAQLFIVKARFFHAFFGKLLISAMSLRSFPTGVSLVEAHRQYPGLYGGNYQDFS